MGMSSELVASYSRAAFFGLAYISCTTIVSMFNKKVFDAGFRLPVSLCFFQQLGNLVFLLVGQWLMQQMYPDKYGVSKSDMPSRPVEVPMYHTDKFWQRVHMLFPVALCLALNIVLTNWSLFKLDLNVFIVLRASTIVWIVLLGYLMLGQRVSAIKALACSLVLVGGLAVAISFAKNAPTKRTRTVTDKVAGVAFCLASTIANGFMLILMKKVLAGPGMANDTSGTSGNGSDEEDVEGGQSAAAAPASDNLKFAKFDFFFYQSVNCAAVLGVTALMLEGLPLFQVLQSDSAGEILQVLATSSFMSIFYQLSLIGLVQSTTPLSKEIISQSKIVPQTMLAIVFFDEHYTSTTVLGLMVAVCGLALYSYVSFNEDKRAVQSKSLVVPSKHRE